MILYIIAAALAPGLFWGWFVYKRDRCEPEPLKMVGLAFAAGVLSVVPALIIEILMDFHPLINAAVVAPAAEETAKFLMVVIFFLKARDFNEAMDGIVYSAAVALGFASLENIGYLFSAAADGSFLHVSAARALLSVPGHFLFSTIWGYGLGMYKFGYKGRGFLFLTLAGGITAHGLFNFLLFNMAWGALFFIILVIVMWRVFLKNSKSLENRSVLRWKGKKDKHE